VGSVATAYTSLAKYLGVLGFWGHLPMREASAKAREAVLKALELDESQAEGHVVMSGVRWLIDWDLAACEQQLRRAIELNPSSESAHLWQAQFLLIIRQERGKALEEARLALDLDPLSPSTNFGVAWLLLFADEHERAVDQARKTLELYPDSPQAYYVLGWAYAARSMWPEAVHAFESAVAASRDTTSISYLGHAYARSGQNRAAQDLLEELRSKSVREHVPPILFALLYSGLGDFDRAFESLGRCYEERDSHLFYLSVLPGFDPLRSDPRYEALLLRLGLPAQAAPAPEPSPRRKM